MTNPLVARTIATRQPNGPDEVQSYVTREIGPTLAQLRTLYNALVEGLNGDATLVPPVAGYLQIGPARFSSGTVTPNGNVVGSVGDLYTWTGGGAGTTLWVKEAGAATNVGWVGK